MSIPWNFISRDESEKGLSVYKLRTTYTFFSLSPLYMLPARWNFQESTSVRIIITSKCFRHELPHITKNIYEIIFPFYYQHSWNIMFYLSAFCTPYIFTYVFFNFHINSAASEVSIDKNNMPRTLVFLMQRLKISVVVVVVLFSGGSVLF